MEGSESMDFYRALREASRIADIYGDKGIACGVRFDEEQRAFMVVTDEETLAMIEVTE